MRLAAQCVDRLLHDKTDYAVVAFADKRFADPRRRAMLPDWLRQTVADGACNLSTDVALGRARQHLREMAQPAPRQAISPTESMEVG